MKRFSGFVYLAVASLVNSVPSHAQMEPVGEWAPQFHEDAAERGPGPEVGDFTGYPINRAALLRGEAWDASLLTLPENQCRPHPSDYGVRGPANTRVSKEVDPVSQQVIAYHAHISWGSVERTIWMDGRPHPPEYAPHTWQGFSTGKWQGDTLVVTITHLKEAWLSRNGIPRSDRATDTQYWIRHDRYLTIVDVIRDPVYLTEPFIRSTDFVADPRQSIAPYPCEPVDEIERPRGTVPHHLPGTGKHFEEFSAKHDIPIPVLMGGAEELYPEYRRKMAAMKRPSGAPLLASPAK
jgi:hypothetical protein